MEKRSLSLKQYRSTSVVKYPRTLIAMGKGKPPGNLGPSICGLNGSVIGTQFAGITWFEGGM
jgi:hypothetical protein